MWAWACGRVGEGVSKCRAVTHIAFQACVWKIESAYTMDTRVVRFMRGHDIGQRHVCERELRYALGSSQVKPVATDERSLKLS